MIDPLISVTSVRPLPDFKLRLVFSDGAEGVFDCKPVLWGEVFEPLKDQKFFDRVFLDYGVPNWPNGADLDAAVLRDEIEKSARKSAPRTAKATLVHDDPASYGDKPRRRHEN